MSYINKRVPAADQFFPENEPPIGSAFTKVLGSVHYRHIRVLTTSCPTQDVYPQNAEVPNLFKPITLRGVTFKNRIFVVSLVESLGFYLAANAPPISLPCVNTALITVMRLTGISCTSAYVLP